jgi:carboxymethylenebutenolidase
MRDMRINFLHIAALLVAIAPILRAADAPSMDTAAQALKASPRHGEWVDIAIPGSDTKLHTWVVYPEKKDKAGVVLVIHEIFGLSDWVRSVADALAAEGFIAVAPDFVSGMGPNGGGSESLGDNVRDTIRKVTPDEQVKRLDAAREYALTFAAANGKTATIGFCWGGTASFNYASRQPKLNAAVVYYGTAPKEKEALAKISAPVLGLYGGDDGRVTQTVEPTKKLMKELDKPYDPHVYDGAGHGFLRQQSGKEGANQKAATDGWKQTIAFLKKNLEG